MKKSRLYVFLLSFVLLFVSFGCNKQAIREEKELSFTISEKDYPSFKRVTDLFLEENPDYSIQCSIKNSNHLSYYLAHDKIDTDFVIVDDLVQLNLYGSSLLDITDSEALQNFSSYIFNFIKNKDSRILAMPSPGKAYCYCVNLDLFEKYNLQVPTTIGELKEFTAHLGTNLYPLVSSSPDNQIYLDYLMQTTIPTFFSTAKGLAFFNDYIFSRKHIRESDSYSDFMDVLSNFKYLTNKENFSIPSRDEAVKAFLNQKAFILSVNPNFDLKKAYLESNASFRYEMRPFVGRQPSDRWVCSLPDFYLSCMKSSYPKKKKEINAFFSFFSGEKAQEELRKDEGGNILANSFSYSTSSDDMMSGAYEHLNPIVNHGRIFLLDEFLYAFRMSYAEIQDYALGLISKTTLADYLDSNMFSANNYEKKTYYIPDFDCMNLSEEERRKRILSKISSDLKKRLLSDVLILPDSFLIEDIFNGILYNSELDIVFDSSLSIYAYEMKGKQLTSYLKENDATLSTDDTIAGIRKDDTGFLFNNRQPINSEAVYLVHLPYDLDQASYTKKGNPLNILSEYTEIIDEEYKK